MTEWERKRKEALLSPLGGIISPANSNVPKYAPFNSLSYSLRNKTGDLGSMKWQQLLSQPATELISPNPFLRSKARDGYSCWDAAVAIPACAIRNTPVDNPGQIKAAKNTNGYWSGEVVSTFKQLGIDDGKVIRPSASYMIDLVKHPDGWVIMEAAHVLAHHRGDFNKVKRFGKKPISNYLKKTLSELVIGLVFDLPIFVGNYRNKLDGSADLPYGINLNITNNFMHPMVSIPCDNTAAPLIDSMLLLLQVALYIEPYPFGFISGTMKYDIGDRWACLPTIINIVGYEVIDVITHQNMLSNGKHSSYVMHYLDLLSPDTLHDYISLGRQTEPFIPDNVEWYNVADWLNSQNYKDTQLQTPPLPCNDCLMFNYGTQGKPLKPKGYKPKKIKKKSPWDHYVKDIRSIFNLIKIATRLYEAQFYLDGLKGLRANWKARNEGWKLKLKRLRIIEKTLYALEKRKKGRQLTRNDEDLIRKAKKIC